MRRELTDIFLRAPNRTQPIAAKVRANLATTVKRTALRRASAGFFVLGVPPTLCAGLPKNSYCRTA
jgi:hypothetical protein